MVDRVVGQNIQSLPRIGQKTANPGSRETSFMDILRDKFAEVTGRMSELQGMPGVYSFNNGVNASLDMSSSLDINVSSLI